MNNIDIREIKEEIKNPENIETKSTQIERLSLLEKNAEKPIVIAECKNLNNIFTQELEKKGLNFVLALNKLENPIGIS